MPKVEIYTRPFCGFCARAKSLLTRKGVDFVEYDSSQDASYRGQMIERSGGGNTFPQIFIDDRLIGGCDDLMMLDANGELDPLLS